MTWIVCGTSFQLVLPSIFGFSWHMFLTCACLLRIASTSWKHVPQKYLAFHGTSFQLVRYRLRLKRQPRADSPPKPKSTREVGSGVLTVPPPLFPPGPLPP